MKLHITAAIIVSITLLMSCSDDSLEQNTNSQINTLETTEKLANLGFDTHTIAPKWNEEGVTVEGDIFLATESLQQITSNAKQRYRTVVFCNTVNQVKIFNTVPNTKIRKALTAAIRRWNAIPNVRVNFIEVNNEGDARDGVLVKDKNLSEIFAESEFARSGIPGRAIFVDIKATDSRINNNKRLTQAQWTNVLTHQLGHIIGFAHNNEREFTFIPNTANDKNSVMDSDPIKHAKTAKFSRKDIIAIKALYGTGNNAKCK